MTRIALTAVQDMRLSQKTKGDFWDSLNFFGEFFQSFIFMATFFGSFNFTAGFGF